MKPEAIAEEFIRECERVLDKKLTYIIVGSVRKGRYVEGKSDIDVMIFAENGFIYPKEWLEIDKIRKKFGKKYWKVKKGKMVSVIDIVITPYPDVQVRVREELKRIGEL